MKNNYNHTIYASYLGYITQAIVNNFAPLLFLTFQSTYNIPLREITVLVTVNFGIQLVVDCLAARYVDRIGYKTCVVAAHIFAAAGLVGLGVFPEWFANPYHGLLLSIALYAVGGGLIEVLISPIVEACPTEKKSAAMSLLHSFYCWGHVAVVIFTTVFFGVFGIGNWKILAAVWALVPIVNSFYFSQVPIMTLHEEGEGMSVRELFKTKVFWILAILMVCAGASEQAMSQWASVFAESGLQVSKTVGDLAGPCMFAVMMGCSRVFYGKCSEKINLEKFMLISCVLCIGSYLMASLFQNPVLALIGCGLCGLSVGIMWPGCFSIATVKCRKGGTAMFAFFALAGDLGCGLGPAVVGMAADLTGGIKSGVLAGIVFPVLLLIGLVFCFHAQGGRGSAEVSSNLSNL